MVNKGHKKDDPSQEKLLNLFFAALMCALTGSILGLGLRGKFAPLMPTSPSVQVTTTNSDGTMTMHSPFNANSMSKPVVMSDEAIPPPMTYGDCLVDVKAQEEGYTQDWCYNMANPPWPACYPLGVPGWHRTDNIIVTFPDPAVCGTAISDSWQIAGWYTTYVQLAPDAIFTPPPLSSGARALVKVISGSLIDVGENGIMREDGQWETYPVTPPLMTRSLKVPHSTEQVRAGENGAAFIWFVVPEDLLDTPVLDMDSPPASLISGPYSSLLQWKTFYEYAGDDNLKDLDFWNMPGILVNNYDGSRLHYNQWWTVLETNPVDGGYHDHTDLVANNTFAELHMTLYAATASAGMQTQMPGTENTKQTWPGGTDPERWYTLNTNWDNSQLVLPMPNGYAHGPIWAVNTDTGRPFTCPSGGVMYPWHRLVLGTNPDGGPDVYHDPPRFHLWMAFEHPPEHVTIPQQMLAQWHNAYLQNRDGNCPRR